MSDFDERPAGWYPMPEGHQRYWDGDQWTDHTTPGADAATTTEVGTEAPTSPQFPKWAIPLIACRGTRCRGAPDRGARWR